LLHETDAGKTSITYAAADPVIHFHASPVIAPIAVSWYSYLFAPLDWNVGHGLECMGYSISGINHATRPRTRRAAINCTGRQSSYVFPNSLGNAYTHQAFKLGFNRLKKDAKAAGLEVDFTFHDLRHFFVTEYKDKTGVLPELHANPETTERVYNNRKTVKRKGL
jgi:hypothetical protein